VPCCVFCFSIGNIVVSLLLGAVLLALVGRAFARDTVSLAPLGAQREEIITGTSLDPHYNVWMSFCSTTASSSSCSTLCWRGSSSAWRSAFRAHSEPPAQPG